MLDRRDFEEAPETDAELRSDLLALRRQLAAAQAKNRKWRVVIERHLKKGCPSESLLSLLIEPDLHGDL